MVRVLPCSNNQKHTKSMVQILKTTRHAFDTQESESSNDEDMKCTLMLMELVSDTSTHKSGILMKLQIKFTVQI